MTCFLGKLYHCCSLVQGFEIWEWDDPDGRDAPLAIPLAKV